jgi:glucosamine--fructose-6-phosphate aminotransferase (isomerizing)
MAGEKTRAAVAAQPAWLAQVPAGPRLPAGRIAYTGCGTSFHAAQTGGPLAVQALEAVLSPPEADLLVCVSHEGETPLTLEAARAFPGPVWLVTGRPDGPIAELADEVVVATPELEESYCHTVSYTCAVATLAALRGEDVSWLPAAVAEELERDVGEPPSGRVLIAGAGRDWPTAQEAALKLREGAYLPAEAHETEQLLHGHLAAIDETVRAYVLEGEGRAAGRARDAVRALEAIGCEVELVATRHPAVDVVRFQRLTIAAAAAKAVDPDLIRWDDSRWKAARDAYS